MFSGPATGLWSSPNPFSQTPAGTLKTADNVRFTASGVIEPRRGFKSADNGIGTGSLIDSMAYYGVTILAAYDLTKVAIYTSSWSSFSGTFEPVGDNRMRFEGAAKSMFFNTTQGLYAWDGSGSVASQPVVAGAPPGLDLDAQPDTASGWLASDSAVAYRYTVCSKDAFGRIIEGAPSGRVTLRNSLTVIAGELSRVSDVVTATYNLQQAPYVLYVDDQVTLTPGEGTLPTGFPAGPKTITAVNNTFSSFSYAEVGTDAFSAVEQTFQIAVSGSMTIWLPPDATTQNFIRVYRSYKTITSVANGAGANQTPSDELFQVHESGYLTATDLAAGAISFLDTTPESQLDVPLYTNANTDTQLAALYQPPRALDISYWADRMWFANTEDKHSLQFTILGTGAPDGVQVGTDFEIYHSVASWVIFDGVNYDPLLATPVNADFSTSSSGGSLTAGTYYYRVVATANSGLVYSLPSEETSQVVLAASSNTVTVNWGLVTGATGYKIYGRTTGAELLIASVGAVSTYVDTGSITPSGALPVKPSMQDHFYVRTDSDPGANIETTAKSLVRSINLSLNNTATVEVNAYYVSREGGPPGQINLVARAFGDTYDFSLYSSNTPNAWQPPLPSTPVDVTAPASSSNAHPARLAWSPLGIPDASPLPYYLGVNSDNDAILRIFPLHYRMLIFKTDGIYTCTNLEPFTITKLSAYKLLAPDSVCVLEDRVYALTDQGIITISDGGVVQISNPIDDIFNAMMSAGDIQTVATRTFGLSYRSERQVLMWMPELNSDLTVTDDNNQAFVFSTLSGGFTRYAFGARCGAINNTTNTLHFAPTDSDHTYVENKTLTDADYYDLGGSDTAFAITGAALTFVASSFSSALVVGDALGTVGGAGNIASSYKIVALSDETVAGRTVTLNAAPPWTANSTVIRSFHAFPCEVEFNKLTDGRPAELKMVGQVSFLFRKNGINDTITTFSTEISTDPEDVVVSGIGWGDFNWGGVPWGSPTKQIIRVEPLPSNMAQAAQLSVGFSTRQALAKFDFLGIDVVEADDAKVSRD